MLPRFCITFPMFYDVQPNLYMKKFNGFPVTPDWSGGRCVTKNYARCISIFIQQNGNSKNTALQFHWMRESREILRSISHVTRSGTCQGESTKCKLFYNASQIYTNSLSITYLKFFWISNTWFVNVDNKAIKNLL